MYTTKTPIDVWRFNVPQLIEFLAFSVKDRYQLNYFICIKDFNVQTITSLNLNLLFFLYLLLWLYIHESESWKENELSWYISVIRQTVFTQRFLSVSMLSDILTWSPYYSVSTGSRLPNILDVKTRKRRNIL